MSIYMTEALAGESLGCLGDFEEGYTERESLVPTSLLGRRWPASSEGYVKSDSVHGLGQTPAKPALLPSLSFFAMCSWMCEDFSRAGGTSGLHREREDSIEVVSPCHALSRGLWQPSEPHDGPVRITYCVHPAWETPQGEAETHILVFLSRLSRELPKYSNVRVNEVCIGEQFVRRIWRITGVLSGTFEPKSKRSSSCVVLAVLLSHATGAMLPTTLVPIQRATLGGMGE